MVTKLLYFSMIFSRALPHLRALDVTNAFEQQEKVETTTNNCESTNLTTLILFDIRLH
jgi:hypothetical protein